MSLSTYSISKSKRLQRQFRLKKTKKGLVDPRIDEIVRFLIVIILNRYGN